MRKYPSVSYELAAADSGEDRMWKCASPFRDTRREAEAPVLTTVYCLPRLGAAAAKLILKEDYGYMVGMVNGKTQKVPLEEVAGKLKMVDPNSDDHRVIDRSGNSLSESVSETVEETQIESTCLIPHYIVNSVRLNLTM